ncbi:MAG TPA: guanylate kinase, partial [Verrucomicrobiae bacterium]|nr:guanylate kinase [Verrucomicrobiae bacterium]
MSDTTPNPNPLLIVISAPSGGGKTTLVRELLASNDSMTRAVTCTTREPRPGEKDGVDYYFLDAASFLKRV